MVPPVLMMTTCGKAGFCLGSGGDANAGLVPLPDFFDFDFGCDADADVVAAFDLDDDGFSFAEFRAGYEDALVGFAFACDPDDVADFAVSFLEGFQRRAPVT